VTAKKRQHLSLIKGSMSNAILSDEHTGGFFLDQIKTYIVSKMLRAMLVGNVQGFTLEWI